jgi:hypothetical protein
MTQLTLPLDFDTLNVNTNKGNTMDNLQYAGTFSVDSGQAIIGDPCYLDEWENWDSNTPFNYEGKENQYGYLGACATTLKDKFGPLGFGSAVVMSTGYGDGAYPVYVKLNEDGRVVMAVIDFNGELDEEQE